MYKQIIGSAGEMLAKDYLIKNKYKILETNYKNRLGEIDIIAKQKDTIVFIEVKTRASDFFGRPSEAVGSFKQKKIRDVASLYLIQNKRLEAPVRFDVIELCKDEFNHIINAF